LLKNDIKIIEFTATPDGTIYDLMNWGVNAHKIKMEPGQNYTSCFDLKNQGRVHQYDDLCCFNKTTKKINKVLVSKNINKIKKHIDKYAEPKYHIIRTPNGNMANIVINNFKKIIDNDMKVRKYDKESDIDDINNILKIKPKLRCSKTLYNL